MKPLPPHRLLETLNASQLVKKMDIYQYLVLLEFLYNLLPVSWQKASDIFTKYETKKMIQSTSICNLLII